MTNRGAQREAPAVSLFLETTAQVARTLGSYRERDKHFSVCGGCKLLSSAYVLGELKKTFLHDAVMFHTILTDAESTSEALHRAQRYRGRRTNRMYTLFARLAEDNNMEREAVLEKLERLIDWQLEARFRYGLTDVLDETHCIRAAWTPAKDDGVYDLQMSCTKDALPDCGIVAFWDEHRGRLELIRAVLQARDRDVEDSDERDRVIEESSSVLNGGRPQGNTCAALADAIIAIECPEDAQLQTTNAKHFGALCEALGRVINVWRWDPKEKDSGEGKGTEEE